MTATLTELLRAQPTPTVPIRSRARQFTRRRVAAIRRHTVDIALLGPVLAAAAWVHVRSMYVTPARFDDEGTYVAQAWAIQNAKGLAHYTYWYDHPPIGWIQIAVLEPLLSPLVDAPNAVGSGRVVMLLFKLAMCIALYVLALRLGMRRIVATIAVALVAFSPLAVLVQRMVYLDNIEAFWIIAAFAVVARRDLTVGGAALGAALFGIGVLSKETGLVIFPAFVYLAWQRLAPEVRRFGLTLLFVTAGLVISTYPLLALLRNELLPGDGHVSLWEGVAFQLWERPTNGPLWQNGTVAHGHVEEWIALDPFLSVAGAVLVVPALFVSKLRAVAIALLIQLVVPLRGGYLPGPYAIMMLPFIVLVVAGLGEVLFDALSGARGRDRTLGRRKVRLAAGGMAMVAIVAGGAAIARDWSTEYPDRLFDSKDDGMVSAQAWVEANVERDATLVVDDSLWVDFVEAGFDADNVIWFWKLDDPDVVLADGWRSVDYAVMSSAYDACSQSQCQKVVEIIEHSTPVATWGEGVDAMTVYRVEG